MQALARMGASVTGIEPQQDNIKAAVAHAEGDPVVAARTKYLALTAEELAASGMASMQACPLCLLLQEGVYKLRKCTAGRCTVWHMHRSALEHVVLQHL